MSSPFGCLLVPGTIIPDPPYVFYDENIPLTFDPSESVLTHYVRWKLHTQVKLECDAEAVSHWHLRKDIPTSKSPNSVSSHPRRQIHLPTMIFVPSSGKMQITMYVERILGRNVAVLADCHSAATSARWVIKFYRSDSTSLWYLDKELSAYKCCQVLQGAEIPVFYGEWKICGAPVDACSALLMESILPGTTVGSLRDGFLFLPERDEGPGSGEEPEGYERRKARFRLAWLHSSGTRAVDRINECGVEHNGLFAENMLVASGSEMPYGEYVVVVGFENAIVCSDQGLNVYEDWRLFNQAFMIGYGPGRKVY